MLTHKTGRAYEEFQEKVCVSFNASNVESKKMYSYDEDGEKFEGIVDDMDRQTGYGRIEYRNGDSYEGDWWLGEYDGQGKYKLAARDWSKTPREKWSTGKDWTFKGLFQNNTARRGDFNDGDGETRLNVGNLIPMNSFWIQAKLSKDDDKVTPVGRRDIILPKDLYKSPTPPAQHHVTERKKLKDLKPLTPEQYEALKAKTENIQSLLRQLRLLT